MTTWKPILTGVGALFLLSASAHAAVNATATTDLNIRSGPGTEFKVIGLVQTNGAVSIDGCVQGSKWCSITHNGVQGWAYSDYLVADISGKQIVVTERPADLDVADVTYDGPAGTLPGAVAGAAVGAVIGGPVGAAIGGAAGAIAGTAIDPPKAVRTYVVNNPVEPVYLDGEVVVGAGLPETVKVTPIPDYEYSYVYVNGVPVLVEPEDRRIVYVVR